MGFLSVPFMAFGEYAQGVASIPQRVKVAFHSHEDLLGIGTRFLSVGCHVMPSVRARIGLAPGGQERRWGRPGYFPFGCFMHRAARLEGMTKPAYGPAPPNERSYTLGEACAGSPAGVNIAFMAPPIAWTEINDETPQAKMELAHREREEDRQEWIERFEAQEKARVQAQTFQEGQNTRLIKAQEKLMDKQTKVAERSAIAAMWSAFAVIVIAVLTAFLAWAAFQAID